MPRPQPIRIRRRAGAGSLAGLRNLGPKSRAWLLAAGIRSRDDLRKLGVIEACRRVRANGQPVSVLLAYALEGALADCHWNALPGETRQALRAEFARVGAKRGIKPEPVSFGSATSQHRSTRMAVERMA